MTVPTVNEHPYQVINEKLIRQCIKLDMTSHVDDEHRANVLRKKRREIQFHDAKWLEMSFKNIHQISNLQGFDSLKVLQLDNNNITTIENVNLLKNLERLDLSFNQISVIENLDDMTNLKILSLFHNKISKIENMEGLVNLSNLSVANNNITGSEDIQYLRQFKKLGTLSIFGNPVCEERNFRYLVLAYLSDLRFFDYRMVLQEERKAAIPYYHDQILKMQDQREKEEVAQQKESQRLEEAVDLDRLNFVGVPELLERMLRNEPDDTNFQLFGYAIMEHLDKLKTDFEERMQEFRRQAAKRLAEKDELVQNLEDKKNSSMEKSEKECKLLIKAFDKKVKHELHRIRQELAPVEALPRLEELDTECVLLSNNLIEIEVNQMNAFTEMIDQFKTNYKDLESSELIASFFRDLRDLESKITETVKLVLEKEHDEYRGDTDKRFEKKLGREQFDLVRPFFDDKDQMQALITKCHEAHNEIVGIKEEELLNRERGRMTKMLAKVSKDEHRRNRERITEINMYISRNCETFEQEKQQLINDE